MREKIILFFVIVSFIFYFKKPFFVEAHTYLKMVKNIEKKFLDPYAGYHEFHNFQIPFFYYCNVPPLFAYFIYPFYKLFGEKEIAFRIPLFIFFLLSIYFLRKTMLLLKMRTEFYLLFLTSPLIFMNFTIISSMMVSFTFFLINFYFLEVYMFSKKIKHLFISCIFAILSFLTHYLGLCSLLPFLVYFYNRKREILLCFLFSAIFALPFFLLNLKYYGKIHIFALWRLHEKLGNFLNFSFSRKLVAFAMLTGGTLFCPFFFIFNKSLVRKWLLLLPFAFLLIFILDDTKKMPLLYKLFSLLFLTNFLLFPFLLKYRINRIFCLFLICGVFTLLMSPYGSIRYLPFVAFLFILLLRHELFASRLELLVIANFIFSLYLAFSEYSFASFYREIPQKVDVKWFCQECCGKIYFEKKGAHYLELKEKFDHFKKLAEKCDVKIKLKKSDLKFGDKIALPLIMHPTDLGASNYFKLKIEKEYTLKRKFLLKTMNPYSFTSLYFSEYGILPYCYDNKIFEKFFIIKVDTTTLSFFKFFDKYQMAWTDLNTYPFCVSPVCLPSDTFLALIQLAGSSLKFDAIVLVHKIKFKTGILSAKKLPITMRVKIRDKQKETVLFERIHKNVKRNLSEEGEIFLEPFYGDTVEVIFEVSGGSGAVWWAKFKEY